MPLISGLKNEDALQVGGVYIRFDELFEPVAWHGVSYEKPDLNYYLLRLLLVEILPGKDDDGFSWCRNLCWVYSRLGQFGLEHSLSNTQYEDSFVVWNCSSILQLHITPEEALDAASCKPLVRPTLPYFEEIALRLRYNLRERYTR